MNKTNIPWADLTWNPITGCTKGCDYCYARAIARRFEDSGNADEGAVRIHDCWQAVPNDVFPAGFEPTVYPHRLSEPLRLKKPSRIFLGSMGDLFDPAFPDNFRDRIFATVAATPQHTYLLLTKQPEEMRRYFTRSCPEMGIADRTAASIGYSMPLPNLWLGVTVTNQDDADERIPLLLDTPSAHRWVSVEPMLGPVDLRHIPWEGFQLDALGGNYGDDGVWQERTKAKLDWVVVGGKTPGKPLHKQGECPSFPGGCGWCKRSPEHACVNAPNVPARWLRDLRDQCAAARVPFFYKHGKDTPALDGVIHDALGGEGE